MSCLKPLRDLLDAEPDKFQTIAEQFGRIQNPSNACKIMDLWYQPRIVEVRQQLGESNMRKLVRHFRKEVVRVLYHIDLKTLFQSLERPLGIEKGSCHHRGP